MRPSPRLIVLALLLAAALSIVPLAAQAGRPIPGGGGGGGGTTVPGYRLAAVATGLIRPVQVGDVVCCYGQVLHIGNTSMKINLEVWVKPILRENEESTRRFKVTEAAFTYVAIDGEGNKQPIKR